MLPIRKIVHPTDFSPSSLKALDVAARLARESDGILIVLHVAARPAIPHVDGTVLADPEVIIEEAQRQFESLPGLDETIHFETRVELGDSRVIVNVAQEVHADLIVMDAGMIAADGENGILSNAPCDIWLATTNSVISQLSLSARQGQEPPIRKSKDVVQEASEESFPASDPPSFVGAAVGRAKTRKAM